ncbi:FGGY-family carbohydrate kinase [Plantactinospora soyae]|uniref:Sugar (Pentulose or hexulose) kinase n=1 Tax=Plantactinospora soyae TaxID=1544732 RepID=A0A927MDI5_9ACTN|nr:FGGY family carbohydrate kinase [Plantactinospora soyae]MBE1492738.1 sugar (pentulose or hexulose) kinase [Plantactinospora soyae]
MGGQLLVGLDVGTTGSKAVVFTELGDPVSQAAAGTPWTTTATGAELDPDALLAAARGALATALADAPPGRVAAVGVASMGESGVLLDSAGHPLGPMIAWHDTRDEDELADLHARIGPDTFARTTGLPLRHQWALTKHRWLRGHHPESRRAVRRLNVAEWVVRGLGGDEACEQSLASRTGWLRLDGRDWWPEALDWSGASASLMPELVTAGTPLGTVADRAGLSRLTGATLTVCGHDHQVAAIGAGALRPGDELDSCGTAEALVRSVAPGLPPETVAGLVDAGVTVGWHALAGRWCLLGATTGGLTLQRVLAGLGLDRADLPELDALASRVDPSRHGVTIEDEGRSIGVPARPLTGAPVTSAGPAEIWRAALESVTEEIGVIHDAMTSYSGVHHDLVAVGGWARSTALMEVKARRLGPVRRSPVAEAGARGAALLAGLAAEVYATADDFPDPARTGRPDGG